VTDTALFLFAGLVGGLTNAMAGGAKLFVFPMLLASGLPPVVANGTATVALWPAQIVASAASRKELAAVLGSLWGAMAAALLGGVAGALLLLWIGNDGFMRAVPFLLVIATSTIALGQRVRLLVPRGLDLSPNSLGAFLLMFLIALYGGFFGAGLGFMLIAALIISGGDRLVAVNAAKNLLAAAINTVAVIPLALGGIVAWDAALLVLAGGMVGGLAGARLISVVPEATIRVGMTGAGLGLAGIYVIRTFG
jgi:uncharacterized membrane protein YfcA